MLPFIKLQFSGPQAARCILSRKEPIMSKYVPLVLALSLIALAGATCPCDGPDPAAREIEFVTTETATGHDVTIRGRIQNLGMQEFQSGPGQQAIQLYEDGTLVATQEFEDLLIGDTEVLTFQRSVASGTEFLPTYRLLITYDPDIFIDGNPQNDDCNTGNNSLERNLSEAFE